MNLPPQRCRSSLQTALSLSQTTTFRQSFAEDVRGCRQAGLARLAVWRRKLEVFGVERAAELLRDQHVTVSSLSWGGGFTGGNGFTFDEAVEDTRTAIFQAVKIGSRVLTLVSGPRWGHIRSHAYRLLIDGLNATVDIAAEHGVTVALQPMSPAHADRWTFLTTLNETLQIVREFDHPFLGIAFGTGHVWRERRLLQRIREAAPYLATVQLSDWRPSSRGADQVLPGDGILPLPGIVQALAAGGYRGDYEIDVWSREVWRSDITEPLARCTADCTGMLGLAPPVGAADHSIGRDQRD